MCAARQRERLSKEQESDLKREAARWADANQEATQLRERLADADRKFRAQVKEHMEDISRLTSRATPRERT